MNTHAVGFGTIHKPGTTLTEVRRPYRQCWDPTREFLKAVADGEIDGHEFKEGHFRIFLPGQEEKRRVDWWPSTGTMCAVLHATKHGDKTNWVLFKRQGIVSWRKAIPYLTKGRLK